MKIELTMTELMLIVDMIKNGTEQDNEGDDFYLMQDFVDGKDNHKSKEMKTPMQLLIDEMKLAREFCDDPKMEMDIWHTLDVLIAKGEVLIEKEKEVMCKFAERYLDSIPKEHPSVEDLYNETFNVKER